MKEEWRQIHGFEDYDASNLGRVRSRDRMVKGKFGNEYLRKGKILSQYLNNKGYLSTGLTKNGRVFNSHVHRFIALAWILNPHNKPEVNHKNGIKTDNRPDNLEWCTNEENVKHSVQTGLHKPRQPLSEKEKAEVGKRNSRPVTIVDLKTKKRRTFKSFIEAGKYYGISHNAISQAKKNNRPFKDRKYIVWQ